MTDDPKDANTRHTPEGGGNLPHVWSAITNLCIYCDVPAKEPHSLTCPKPQSGAPPRVGRTTITPEGSREVDAASIINSPSFATHLKEMRGIGEGAGHGNDAPPVHCPGCCGENWGDPCPGIQAAKRGV